jgi:hypothetical protein
MPSHLCSRRLLRPVLWTPRAGRVLLGVVLLTAVVRAQVAPKPEATKSSAHRANELTLAGLRPGQDSATRGIELNGKPTNKSDDQNSQMVWDAICQKGTLFVDLDGAKRVQVIRVTINPKAQKDCFIPWHDTWKTGRGLGLADPATRVLQLYGKPDSRSPSTKEGQPLELWYYAFDWAGADVPQVMEVLCTREADGKPGRVVEITLAGPSL